MSVSVERGLPRRRITIFSALRFHDFRLLWVGLLISNLGSWMQLTATGYYIAILAGNPHTAALYLGLQGLGRAIPVLLLSPVAGVVADTFPRRRILFITNSVMVLLALILAVFTSLGWMNIVGLILINAASATTLAFDSPARQSWVPLMVEREYVGNAIGLNSVAFNAPAVIGPAIAGGLIIWSGIAGSFYVNAVLSLAVILALVFMKPAPPSTGRPENWLGSIVYGLRFLVEHPILKWIIAIFVLTAVLVRPYSMLLPAFIVNTLHGNAFDLSLAISATGVGGFAGALLTAYLGTRERRGTIWLVSSVLMALGVMSLGFIWSLWLALPVLFVIGTSTMTLLGASNTLIQTLSPDHVRGRAISVYTMVAIGVVPGGALVVGAIGSFVGLHMAFLIVGAVSALFALWPWITRPILRTV
ncbi:MAG TPA: MFS transporter [Candidatus Rubrimentiphilum sp.]|nr:MFS transporter [Candidatus Rubrimentiphilum sp.]